MHRVLALALFLCLGANGPVAAAQGGTDDSRFESGWTPLVGVQPAQWRVVWHDDPTTSATISWSTREPGTRHLVHLGDPLERMVAATRNGPFSPDADEGERNPREPLAYYHHARVTGLTPGTRVDFRVVSDGESSPPLHFRTAPKDGAGFEFLYGGDSRTGWVDRCRVNQMIAALAEKRPGVLCFVHGGDYVTDGLKSAQWLRWLSHHELTTAASGRVLPIVPARGNHDRGPCYAEVFDGPGTGGGAWFRTDLGADVAILNLDTNVSALGEQFEWMITELPRARSSARWLMLNYHRPMFPAVKEPAKAAPFWVPVFERNNVDLVLESDGHCMKRTVAVRGGKPDPSGVTYVGEGGLGVPQRVPDASRWAFQNGGFTMQGHHVTVVTVGERRITTRFARLDDASSLVGECDPLIAAGAEWSYCVGKQADDAWIQVDFDDAAWPRGNAGIGFSDDDDATVLDDMRNAYDRVAMRKEFTWDASAAGDRHPVLWIDHDDGFVAYLNGVEFARSCVSEGEDGQEPTVTSHEAGRLEAFDVRGHATLLRDGTNVLAIEGYKAQLSSSDFSLHPRLGLLPRGLSSFREPRWTYVDEHVVPIRTTAPR